MSMKVWLEDLPLSEWPDYTKVCSCCKIEKPVELFHKTSRAYCKECHTKKMRPVVRKYSYHKKNRTPSWYSEADDAFLEDLMEQQELINDAWGLAYDIDHIIPIQGDSEKNTGVKVCGLHCKENWQLIPATENRSKGCQYEA